MDKSRQLWDDASLEWSDHARRRHLMGVMGATIALLVVGIGDYFTGWTVSVATLYIIPVVIAAWNVGPRTGILFCFIAACVRLGVNFTPALPISTNFWNSGMLFGLLLTVVMLIDPLKKTQQKHAIPRTLRRAIGFGLGVAILFAAMGFFAEKLDWFSPPRAAATDAPLSR